MKKKRIKYNSGSLTQHGNISSLMANNDVASVNLTTPKIQGFSLQRNIFKPSDGPSMRTDIIKFEKDLNKGRSIKIERQRTQGGKPYTQATFTQRF